ncbi:hypothetical protein EPIB1_1676 [Tritonibacter mobilis]|nr:conserved hypothetical protein [Ruegeria sp. TrichCH4B]VCU58778.1 hypothetical protein EPIB1_1676 [Tritonibacter mobilis]
MPVSPSCLCPFSCARPKTRCLSSGHLLRLTRVSPDVPLTLPRIPEHVWSHTLYCGAAPARHP